MSGRPLQFVDLGSQHEEVRDDIQRDLSEIFRDSAFVGGRFVEGFERDFGAYLGGVSVVGVSNGTDAVKLALQAVGTTAGDAVVTVSHTFIGTIEGALQLGASPLFVDVDEDSMTMSAASLRRFLEQECERRNGRVHHRRSGRRIGAIVPVHLYGQSADMEPLLALAREHGVPLVEDAAQAQGASYRFSDGRTARCGSMGDAGAFSFYASKNLGAAGEAGAVVLRDPELAERVRRLREHGQSEKYVHVMPDGGNYRLDAIQAAVLRRKLTRLDAWNDARRAAARRYAEVLSGSGLVLPVEAPYAYHVYHLYVVRTPERDRVRAELTKADVPTGLHYPIPLHLQPALESMDVQGMPLPVTERAAATCLSLPMHGHLEPEHVERVASHLMEVVTPGIPA